VTLCRHMASLISILMIIMNYMYIKFNYTSEMRSYSSQYRVHLFTQIHSNAPKYSILIYLNMYLWY